MVGNECVGGWVIKGKYAKMTADLYRMFEFIMHYLIHTVALVILYGKVIRASRKMLKRQDDTTSTATQKVIY